MIRNQQSSWHDTLQKDISSITPAHLELVPGRAKDLELCTPETLRRTQQELQWYRSLYDNTPSLYFTLDATGRILSANKLGADSLGYTPEELIETSIFNLFEQSEKQRLSNAFKELLTASPQSKITNWEFRLNVTKIMWVKVTARILASEDGHFLLGGNPPDKFPQQNPLILMICEDITAHKQTEELLRESEERFHIMADTAPVMLWMSGSNSLCNFFNQSWLNFTGRSLEQEQGLGWLESVHSQDQDFCLKTYESAFNARAKFQMEYRLKRHDGNYRWILDSGVPRFTSAGKFAGYIGSCIDITERKSAEVALQETQEAAQARFDEMENLNRLKDKFLSTISDELRTPLTNMKMAIQMLGISLNKEQNFLLEMDKPQTERSKAARYFQILDNECDREINLINNFLDLQKLDSNAKPLVLETIQLQQWLWRVLEVFQARNRNSSQQEFQLNIAANLPPLVCDPFSLERILLELLTNACKFSPPGAQITLSAQLKSKEIQLQVVNTGVEIPTTEIPLIFNKFYRIPSNDPSKQGGTGLGLALVQKLIFSLGGTIEVESESKHTCFTILLPRVCDG